MSLLLAFVFSQALNSPPKPASLVGFSHCAVSCGYLMLRLHGVAANFEEFRANVLQEARNRGEGAATSMQHLLACLANNGLAVSPIQIGYDGFAQAALPAIAHLRHRDREHYVVVVAYRPDAICVLDAPYAARWLRREAFELISTGAYLIPKDSNQVLLRSLHFAPWLFVATCVVVGLAVALAALHLRSKRWLAASGYAVPGCGAAAAYIVGWGSGPTLAAVDRSLEPLKFVKPHMDLGALATGDRSVELALTNTGAAPIKITKIKSSCKCLMAERLPDVPLLPGKKTLIIAKLKVSPEIGSATLFVEGDDGKHSAATTLTWHGPTQLVLSQRAIEVESVPLGGAFFRELQVVYPGGVEAPAPRLISCDCDRDDIEVRQTRVNPEASVISVPGVPPQITGEATLSVTMASPAEPQLKRARCKLKFDYAGEERELLLLLKVGFAPKDLSLSSRLVVYSAERKYLFVGETRHLEITDKRNRGELRLANVPDWLEAKLELKPDGQGQVHFKLLKPPPTEFAKAVVRLERPDDPEATCPITVLVYAPKD